MSNGDHPPGSRGFAPPPKTPLQWHQLWTQQMRMSVPGRSGRVIFVDLENVDVPERGTPGDPDLLMTTTSGKRFYVQFRRGQTFRALDLPLLVYPADVGAPQALWVLPR